MHVRTLKCTYTQYENLATISEHATHALSVSSHIIIFYPLCIHGCVCQGCVLWSVSVYAWIKRSFGIWINIYCVSWLHMRETEHVVRYTLICEQLDAKLGDDTRMHTNSTWHMWQLRLRLLFVPCEHIDIENSVHSFCTMYIRLFRYAWKIIGSELSNCSKTFNDICMFLIRVVSYRRVLKWIQSSVGNTCIILCMSAIRVECELSTTAYAILWLATTHFSNFTTTTPALRKFFMFTEYSFSQIFTRQSANWHEMHLINVQAQLWTEWTRWHCGVCGFATGWTIASVHAG